jgi:mRNA-degrading endonuclease toxin of MazEF toxin-antitoxin module
MDRRLVPGRPPEDPQQGDIYWIDIPEDQTEGSEQYGSRPAVVMSRDAINRRLSTVVVVPLTTFGSTATAESIAKEPPFRIAIPASEITKDLYCDRPISLCVAKTDQARVVAKTRLKEKVGRLSKTAVISVSGGLAFLFDIR